MNARSGGDRPDDVAGGASRAVERDPTCAVGPAPAPFLASGLAGADAARHAVRVTTRLGFAIIIAGAVLLALRAVGLVDAEGADIMSVLLIVVGALVVAIDGEAADHDDA